MYGRRRFILSMAAVAAGAGFVGAASRADAAERTAASGWEQLPIPGLTYRLYAPPTGPLYAQQPGGILRSDDAGLNWSRVKVPAPPDDPHAVRFFATSPATHDTMYASSPTGLQRALYGDDASWQTIADTPELPYSFGISPADPNVMYLGVAMKPVQSSGQYRLLRSLDGGDSWETIGRHGAGGLTEISLLSAHPLDPYRVFRISRAAKAGEALGALMESLNQGSTWMTRFHWPGNAFASIIGGSAAMPDRFYLTATAPQTGAYRLVRLDQAFTRWLEISPELHMVDAPPSAERIALRGLAYDPQNPDRVFVGVSAHRSNRTPGVPSLLLSRVMASEDGGLYWHDLGLDQAAEIVDMKLGIDGRNLYVAAGQAVWRLPM